VTDSALRAALADRVTLGLGVTLLRGAHAVAAARQLGCEWLFIDMEHGAYSIGEAAEICLGAACAGVAPLVRSRLDDLSTAARLLDNGCAGIVVPRVRNEAEAHEMARVLRVPPLGGRAIGGAGLAHARGALASAAGRAEVDGRLLLIATIEDAEGLANAAGIATVAGIDVLLLGASDLSFDLGADGNVEDPRIRAGAAIIAEACRGAGRVFGVGGIAQPHLVAACVAMGARMVLAGMDHALLITSAAERVGSLRAAAQPGTGVARPVEKP
jgi:4-hydroxy-2-oxoheptanedioate aldolase